MRRPMHRALHNYSSMCREGPYPPNLSWPIAHPHQPETGANRPFQFPCLAPDVTEIRATCGTNLGARKEEFAPPMSARWMPVCWYSFPGGGATRSGEGPFSFARAPADI